MKRIVIILSSIILEINSYSQQLPIYSQYTDNIFIINPAVAGNEGLTTYNIANRTQWLGIQDAPKTSSFSVQGRLLKSKFQVKRMLFWKHNTDKNRAVHGKTGKVGLGCYVFNDRNALIGKTGVQFAYSYHIFLRGSTELSLGLSFSASQFKLDRNRIIAENPYDPILYSDAYKAAFIPNADVGIYLLNRKYFAGISALQLFGSPVKLENNAFDNFQLLRQYFFIAGYNYDINADYLLVPSILVRSTDYISKIQADFSVRTYYKESMWIGVSYRTNKDFVMLVGLRAKKLFFTYSFDYPPNPIKQHSFGTHELSVSLKMGNTTRKFRWRDRY